MTQLDCADTILQHLKSLFCDCCSVVESSAAFLAVPRPVPKFGTADFPGSCRLSQHRFGSPVPSTGTPSQLPMRALMEQIMFSDRFLRYHSSEVLSGGVRCPGAC